MKRLGERSPEQLANLVNSTSLHRMVVSTILREIEEPIAKQIIRIIPENREK